MASLQGVSSVRCFVSKVTRGDKCKVTILFIYGLLNAAIIEEQKKMAWRNLSQPKLLFLYLITRLT
jgi:hypothetical protein